MIVKHASTGGFALCTDDPCVCVRPCVGAVRAEMFVHQPTCRADVNIATIAYMWTIYVMLIVSVLSQWRTNDDVGCRTLATLMMVGDQRELPSEPYLIMRVHRIYSSIETPAVCPREFSTRGKGACRPFGNGSHLSNAYMRVCAEAYLHTWITLAKPCRAHEKWPERRSYLLIESRDAWACVELSVLCRSFCIR